MPKKSNSELQLKPYYGFIITNEEDSYFCKIEEQYVQEYIDADVNDSNKIKTLLDKTQYVYEYGGKSIEYYAWEKFYAEQFKTNKLFNININTCTKNKKSKLIPVLLVSLNIKSDNVSELDKCNPYLSKKLLNPPMLNVMFINPLDRNIAYKYQDMRDTITLNSLGYQEFLSRRVH